MSAVVRKAIDDRRKELSTRLSTLSEQLLAAKAGVDARQVEIDQTKADMAELEAWLTANT